MSTKEVGLGEIKAFNDSRPRRWLCSLWRHRWSGGYRMKVKDGNGTHLCAMQNCLRCGRWKINQVVKHRLSRSERRS